MDVEELLEKMKKYADSHGFALNPDPNVVLLAIKGMLENEKKYGYRYCPCRPISGEKEKDAPKICPCAYHKDEIKQTGHCLCGLFVAKTK